MTGLTMDDFDRQLRFDVINFWLDQCRPPTVAELASQGGGEGDRDETSVRRGLARLEQLHHLTLYGADVPSPTPIAMAHPFSHLPTPYLVKAGDGRAWWANCAWCALGLAAMLYPDAAPGANTDVAVSVHALTAPAGALTVLTVTRDGNLVVPPQHRTDTGAEEYDLHAVFSAPPSRWWADVRFACGTIQLCATRAEAEAWPRRHGFLDGDAVRLDALWRLAKAWYQDKHRYDYERKTPAQREVLFRELGLTSAYWAS
ncbi:AIF-like mitochondrial oxidoreductase (Nfrl) [Purpureocillium lavendulum]|uniref:AIF-like mitochondrial oxidoreductase (Nfrl) n=1 Tax=Purpureocillium lavendulum TaxID=1247861 RepID=A0AB34FYU5_9HYPO|nr:AIF-like mitochondrial oxidoreductase (Nfrl) [Purpureocillium lavendulum]